MIYNIDKLLNAKSIEYKLIYLKDNYNKKVIKQNRFTG